MYTSWWHFHLGSEILPDAASIPLSVKLHECLFTSLSLSNLIMWCFQWVFLSVCGMLLVYFLRLAPCFCFIFSLFSLHLHFEALTYLAVTSKRLIVLTITPESFPSCGPSLFRDWLEKCIFRYFCCFICHQWFAFIYLNLVYSWVNRLQVCKSEVFRFSWFVVSLVCQ